MATPVWIGAAIPVADVWTATIANTLEVGDLFTFTIGNKTWTYTAASTVIATETAAIATAWNALSSTYYPEFAEYTASSTSTTVILTADTRGVPGTISVATTETDGSPSDSQTISITNTTPATGPNFWDNAANWSTGSLPADGDTVSIENSSVSILYGLAQSAIEPAALNIYSTFTGTIGLPKTNATGRYPEYRDQYLVIGPAACTIGLGSGAGSGRLKIDFGSDQVALTVSNTGQPAESGIEAVLVKGTHADNALTVTKGSVGVAVLANETATFKTNVVGYQTSPTTDAKVRFGSGCTLNGSGATFVKTGGEVDTSSSLLNVTQTAGTLTLRGTAAVTGTLTNRGGATVNDYSTGTLTAVDNAGTYEHKLPVAKTITDFTCRKGYRVFDRSGTITWTNPIQFVGCTLSKEDGEIDLGFNRKLTVANI